jgi:hypothetical protein
MDGPLSARAFDGLADGSGAVMYAASECGQ